MLSQVADILAKLLDGYLAAALTRPEDDSHAVAEMQAAAAADIAVELCMALEMRPLLWSSVFPRFAAAGCRQVLLEHLLPHIFRDQLTTLAPEVMQVCPLHLVNQPTSLLDAAPVTSTLLAVYLVLQICSGEQICCCVCETSN